MTGTIVLVSIPAAVLVSATVPGSADAQIFEEKQIFEENSIRFSSESISSISETTLNHSLTPVRCDGRSASRPGTCII